ncbi:hypothetical protein TWF281_003279 [Arthrobotrys megalospora]
MSPERANYPFRKPSRERQATAFLFGSLDAYYILSTRGGLLLNQDDPTNARENLYSTSTSNPEFEPEDRRTSAPHLPDEEFLTMVPSQNSSLVPVPDRWGWTAANGVFRLAGTRDWNASSYIPVPLTIRIHGAGKAEWP